MTAAPGQSRRSIAIAITGASGAIYATRTLAALLSRGVHIELVVSDYGRRLLRDELGNEASVERLGQFLEAKYGRAAPPAASRSTATATSAPQLRAAAMAAPAWRSFPAP
jgi:3-polyprenyl-4-hydroxybenzoate decarboxylase